MVDAVEGVLGIEWIEGKSVRKILPGGEAEQAGEEEGPGEELDPHPEDVEGVLTEYGISLGV
jgi:TP53 regulating kinase-like protein